METQKYLFQQIKESLPNHLSLVDEISELLKISYDSAYRRIRGEKAITIDEMQTLCKHFGISADSLFNIKSGNVVFKDINIEHDGISIKDWLISISDDLKKILSSKEKKIIYAAKDPPFFHYFQFPELAAFRIFLWEKTLLQLPQYEDKKFSLKNYNEEIQKIGEKILAKYIKIPTIEIWNEDTFNITFKQIEYYWISGLFENKDDIYILCDKLYLWIQHIRKQAEYGFKYLYGTDPKGVENSFQFYENEVVLNDNTILVRTNKIVVTYITYNVLSLLITTNPFFCNRIEHYLRGLLRKSILISSVNAKERNRFFNKLLEKIEHFKKTID
ncbi:MAG: hypothetical protein K8R58_03055 [Bacteroidales bacterium]|nr:hypothetical protein [Bacteroidales bacterium]